MEPQPTQNPGNSQARGFLKNLENFFNTYLHQKAPYHLPPKAREWIVKFGPWIILVLIILALPIILTVFSLGAILGPFVAGYAPTRFYHLSVSGNIVTLVAFIIEIAALPGLFGRTLKGWHLLYYAVLVDAVGQLLAGNVISMIINTAIFMYLLFEVREYYK